MFMQLNGFMAPLGQIEEKETAIDISSAPDCEIALVLHYRFMGSGNQLLSQGSFCAHA